MTWYEIQKYTALTDVRGMTRWQCKGLHQYQGTHSPAYQLSRVWSASNQQTSRKQWFAMTRSVSGNSAHWRTLNCVSCWHWGTAEMTEQRTNDALLPLPLTQLWTTNLLFQSHLNVLTYSTSVTFWEKLCLEIESSVVEVNKRLAKWLWGQKHLPCKTDGLSAATGTHKELNVVACMCN